MNLFLHLKQLKTETIITFLKTKFFFNQDSFFTSVFNDLQPYLHITSSWIMFDVESPSSFVAEQT